VADKIVVLPRLTSLRWYAALAVFLYHLDTQMTWRPLKAFNHGWIGVSFFFVLSGFVLTWSTSVDLPAKTFYRRRFARIYPSHLVMFIVAVVLVAAWPRLGLVGGSIGILTSLLLVQAWVPSNGAPVYSYNGVAWTLSCEAFFYALFPFLNRGMRKLSPVARDAMALLLLCVAAAATILLDHFGHSDIAYNDPVVRSAEFVFGMVLAMGVQAGWRPRVPISITIAIVGAAYVATYKLGGSAFDDYILVLPVSLLLCVAARMDIANRRGFLTKRISVYLGEVSFAFYLVHQIVLWAVLKGVGWNHAWTGARGLEPVVVTFAASLCAAALLHGLVELPLQRRLRGGGSIANAPPAEISG
jgi:peptidoglycan/LPS O-acetylase OafA/YrhL